MRVATKADRALVVDILTQSFDENKSVNYIVRQDSKRRNRIRALMQYSFDECMDFGRVVLSDDSFACALLLDPAKKHATFASVTRDLQLILRCTGLSNLNNVLRRESKVKSLQPKSPFYYLWFLGVVPAEQGKGIGRKLLSEVLSDLSSSTSLICLETSNKRNLPFYMEMGFEIYTQLDIGYEIFFLRKSI